MSRQIRNLGLFLALCYAALFVQVNRLTIFEAEALRDRPENNRTLVRDFSAPRGSIVTADGQVVARSVPTDDQYRFQREYPTGELFAHVSGYFAFELGATGVEDSYNGYLTGDDIGFDINRLDDLFVDRDVVGDVVLSMRDDVQQIAKERLGEREGSVVALDPRSGAILALWSYPSYNPNDLATHDFNAAESASELLTLDPEKPTLSRAFRDRFAPGSTFKVVTATAGVERGGVTREAPDYPVGDSYQPPGGGRPISNFGGSSCGGTLFQILQASCNIAFAQMGVDTGGEDLAATAQGFGFDRDVPFDVPGAAQSVFPDTVIDDPPLLAQAAIGQHDVAATPLQMALVAAAVANDGDVMVPHVMREIRDDQGNVVDEHDDEVWTTAMRPDTAGLLREGMISVVTDGTAGRLAERLDDFVVGGKTGTAQRGTDPPSSHAWIIGFAGPPGETPHVAVAVIVEGQPGASEQTGGRVAAPIAAAVMHQALTPPERADQQDGDLGSGA